MTHESSIRWNLTNHPPAGELAEKALDAVTDILISTGEALAAILPDSREKSLTMTASEMGMRVPCCWQCRAWIQEPSGTLGVTPTRWAAHSTSSEQSKASGCGSLRSTSSG